MGPIITDTKAAVVYEFASISDFVNYVNAQSVTPLFQDKELSSELVCEPDSRKYKKFYQTRDYSEAENLLVHGWESGAQEMELKLRNFKTSDAAKVLDKIERKNDFVGFSPIVPLALQGVPNSMVNNVRHYKKQKVVTIEKMINYPYFYSASDIMHESVAALGFVKTLESQGYRCNLDIVACSCGYTNPKNHKSIVLKIRVKKSNERLNIAKMAFPFAHPSFFRRFEFRFIERCKHCKAKAFRDVYGFSVDYKEYVSIIDRMVEENASLARFKKSLVIPNHAVNYEKAMSTIYEKQLS